MSTSALAVPRLTALIVGTQKGGTTALARFLGEHPDVCMAPVKEAHVFDSPDFDAARLDERYAAVFPNYRGQSCVMEATPSYMYLPEVPARLAQYNPALRLIVLLRDPVERAVSQHQMERARWAEWLPLRWALAAEPYRLRAGGRSRSWRASVRRHSYVDRGFYGVQLARLFAAFSREQVLVLKTDDLLHDHVGTLTRTYAFLGLQPPGTFPRARMERMVERREERPPGGWRLPSDLDGVLRRRFRDDIEAVERLLGWDLSAWKRSAAGERSRDVADPAATSRE